MQDNYEKNLICKYLISLMTKTNHHSLAAEAIVDWINDEGRWLRIEIDLDLNETKNKKRIHNSKNVISKKDWEKAESTIVACQKELRTKEPNVFNQNIILVSNYFELTKIEAQLFNIVCHYQSYCSLGDLIDNILRTKSISVDEIISRMMGVTQTQLIKILKSSRSLRASGLISMAQNYGRSDFKYVLPDGLIEALMPPNTTLDEITSCLVNKSKRSNLKWNDFDHIGKERDFIYNILNGVIHGQTKGINILLYGPPGTGKTEFCHVMAERLKRDLFIIKEEDERGAEPTRNERLLHARLSGRLLEKRKSSILLFDEMEDILGEEISFFGLCVGNKKSGSKVFINRLVEENKVPTFWTCNNIQYFDHSLLRRMTVAVELKVPSFKIRQKVWTRVLEKHEFKLQNDEINTLAKEFEAAPALAESAVRATKLARGSSEEMQMAVRLVSKALRGGRTLPISTNSFSNFNENLLNCELDYRKLTQRIVSQKEKQFSLCLYGPPGTGKSAYARYLADQIGMDVVFKRASDLVDKYVGETEKNIADAFNEAIETESFLIFDEADSLLRDRKNARQTWEVSHVNEMLTWMESHPLPFVCTTNAMDSLDNASLRRFTFKIKFLYLTPQKIKEAFDYFFKIRAPKDALNLQVLTPGDFSVVANKAKILGLQNDAISLTKLLYEECRSKPDMPSQIGFV